MTYSEHKSSQLKVLLSLKEFKLIYENVNFRKLSKIMLLSSGSAYKLGGVSERVGS